MPTRSWPSPPRRMSRQCGGRFGDRAALDALGRRRRLVVEQERIVGDVTALLAQLGEQRDDAGVVGRALAGEGDAAGDVAPSLDEVDGEAALVDGAGLADVVVVQPDEVGPLAADVGEQHLVTDEAGRRRGDQLVEVRLVVPAARPCRAHASPPNTSTSPNRQAGEAWPVPTIWLSSPLPQFGVPITLKRGGVADAAQVAPERARDRPVARVADRADDLAVLDQLPVLAAELELVAAVVDRPRRVGLQVHAVLDRTRSVRRTSTRPARR